MLMSGYYSGYLYGLVRHLPCFITTVTSDAVFIQRWAIIRLLAVYTNNYQPGKVFHLNYSTSTQPKLSFTLQLGMFIYHTAPQCSLTRRARFQSNCCKLAIGPCLCMGLYRHSWNRFSRGSHRPSRCSEHVCYLRITYFMRLT